MGLKLFSRNIVHSEGVSTLSTLLIIIECAEEFELVLIQSKDVNILLNFIIEERNLHEDPAIIFFIDSPEVSNILSVTILVFSRKKVTRLNGLNAVSGEGDDVVFLEIIQITVHEVANEFATQHFISG